MIRRFNDACTLVGKENTYIVCFVCFVHFVLLQSGVMFYFVVVSYGLNWFGLVQFISVLFGKNGFLLIWFGLVWFNLIWLALFFALFCAELVL